MTERWRPTRSLRLVEGEEEAAYPKCSLWLRALADTVGLHQRDKVLNAEEVKKEATTKFQANIADLLKM